jgi:hypothetical protein
MKSVLSLAALATLTLAAGCGQLAPPEKASEPVVQEAPATEPLAPAPEVLNLPNFAPEISVLIGQAFSTAFPVVATNCIGSLDGVTGQYNGQPSGVKVVGWGFDLANKAPYEQFVAVDVAGVIQGGGIGNTARPDVVAARPAEVTSEATGYEVLAGVTSGPVTVYGISSATSEACIVGLLAEAAP